MDDHPRSRRSSRDLHRIYDRWSPHELETEESSVDTSTDSSATSSSTSAAPVTTKRGSQRTPAGHDSNGGGDTIIQRHQKQQQQRTAAAADFDVKHDAYRRQYFNDDTVSRLTKELQREERTMGKKYKTG